MAKGWVDLQAVGVIEFTYKLHLSDVGNYTHVDVQLEMAWFKDSGLVLPQSEHNWVIDMITDTILEGQTRKGNNEIPDASDPNFIQCAEYYLGA